MLTLFCYQKDPYITNETQGQKFTTHILRRDLNNIMQISLIFLVCSALKTTAIPKTFRAFVYNP